MFKLWGNYLISNLLKEKLPLPEISGTWLQRYVNCLHEKQGFIKPESVKKGSAKELSMSHFMRKTLSFSKKLENYIRYIIYFIEHYNKSLLISHYPLFVGMKDKHVNPDRQAQKNMGNHSRTFG
ncbi:MAG: hypothetical protein RL368_520 [Pseudomonadota bacterium]|jgi:hypothetical protein